MRIRRNPLPRRLVDVLCFLLIGIFLPVVFMFEIVVVLPNFHDPGSFFHTLHFLMAMFLVFNIKSNMIACMMLDTSCDGECFAEIMDLKTKKYIHYYSQEDRSAGGSFGLARVRHLPEIGSTQVLALQDLWRLHPEEGPSLYIHRLLHRTPKSPLLHGIHLLSLCGICICPGLQLHLLVGVPGPHLLPLVHTIQAAQPTVPPFHGELLEQHVPYLLRPEHPSVLVWRSSLGLPCAHRVARWRFRR